MAREHYIKIFYNKPLLYRLVNLRINGYAYSSLAGIFGVDISSVRHQCDKYELMPVEDIYTIERLITHVLNNLSGVNSVERIASDILRQTQIAEPIWEEERGHRYSIGKTYAEYLAEARYPHKRI